MDFVNWSLTLELAFYVLFASFAAISKEGVRISIMLMSTMASLMLFFLVVKLSSLDVPKWIYTALYRSKFIDYMCIGHAFYLHFKKEISTKKLIIISLIFLSLFWIEMFIEADYNQMKVIGTNYIYGLAIFLICYLLREKFKEVKVLDFLADVSYPLYLLHATCGYAVMSILLHMEFGVNLSFIIALSLVLVASWMLHKIVEKPSNKIGKKITTKNTKR